MVEPKKAALKLRQREKHACYVLITCGEPNPEGKMQVEMTYKGDPALAAFLLENAQGFIAEEISSVDEASTSF